MDFGAEILLIVSRYTFFLSLTILVCFIVINAITKRFVVDKPLKKILRSTDRITAGDFSVRITDGNEEHIRTEFDLIAYRLDKMAEELGDMEVLQENFISNISHEMKTPIAIIKNYAELLQTKNVSEEEKLEYAENIRDAAGKLSALISNILKLNKLENQRIDPEIESYDLCGQLEECILQYEELWDEKELELEVDIEEGAVIQADPSLMELVWNNLISNAIKFTESGGKVTIRQTGTSDHVEVSVSDTGCGMSRESVRHIFDKFYQGDTSHSKEGNGLGLALVRRILDLMNGEIQVISEKGKGSTFTVKLPRQKEGKEAIGG